MKNTKLITGTEGISPEIQYQCTLLKDLTEVTTKVAQQGIDLVKAELLMDDAIKELPCTCNGELTCVRCRMRLFIRERRGK